MSLSTAAAEANFLELLPLKECRSLTSRSGVFSLLPTGEMGEYEIALAGVDFNICKIVVSHQLYIIYLYNIYNYLCNFLLSLPPLHRSLALYFLFGDVISTGKGGTFSKSFFSKRVARFNKVSQ
jgi:hypothetical protein